MTPRFTLDNTTGFNAAEIAVINAAVEALVASGWEDGAACDAVNNAWSADDADNTVAALVERSR